MRKKVQMCITISDKAKNEIGKLIQTLPEKIINNKPQKITQSSIIELYSEIIHTYFDLDQLSIEYELLDIADGRRKNNSV